TALGVPAVQANATNTVSLCPGYIGGTYAQRKDLTGLRGALVPQLIAAAIGGLAGSVLLIVTSESIFREIVPWLILTACLLLAVQDRLRTWLRSRNDGAGGGNNVAEVVATAAAAVYGGYFGAGLGIMLIAVLGLFSDLPLTRLNAVKQLLSVVVGISAAAFLMFSGKVEWTLVLVMAPASLVGGHVGGRFAGSLPPRLLRLCVVSFGVIVAVIYLLR
ncbi:MAG: sulfite exporter TauE/SafE family protein, partial [Ilumatobacteraceae bacterium]